MPISIVPAFGAVGHQGTAARAFGAIQLDGGPNCWIASESIPSTRDLQLDRILNRQGRVTRIKEDQKPLVLTLNGYWADGTVVGNGSLFWRDFKAALMSMSRAPLNLGDGTQFEFCDCTDIVEKAIASTGKGTASPGQVLGWMAKFASYEPYSRETTPSLQVLGALATSNGSSTTNVSVSYPGTAPAEPTWQWSLVIPGGVTVSGLTLQNTLTGEVCSVVLAAPLTTGSWTVLMDASGSIAVTSGSPRTPGNNQYGVLAAPSLGRGVTVVLGGSPVDTDFTGRIPTLIPSSSPTIPPTAQVNTIAATIVATGALTSAALAVLAPSRYIR